MKVQDLMARDVWTCRPGDSLARAAELMWNRDCGVLPVVDGGARLVGVITDRDVCMAAYTQGHAPGEIRVESAMAKTTLAVRPDDTLARARGVMREGRIRRLPVIDGERRVIGMITINDLVRAASRTRGDRDVDPDDFLKTLAAISEPRPERTAPLSQPQPTKPELRA